MVKERMEETSKKNSERMMGRWKHTSKYSFHVDNKKSMTAVTSAIDDKEGASSHRPGTVYKTLNIYLTLFYVKWRHWGRREGPAEGRGPDIGAGGEGPDGESRCGPRGGGIDNTVSSKRWKIIYFFKKRETTRTLRRGWAGWGSSGTAWRSGQVRKLWFEVSLKSLICIPNQAGKMSRMTTTTRKWSARGDRTCFIRH